MIRTLISFSCGAAITILKSGTIIQSIYLKESFIPIIVSTVGLTLSGALLPTEYYKQVKKGYKVTTVLSSIYETYKNFGTTHAKSIAPKHKKENPANNKVHKVSLLNSLGHLGYKAVDIAFTSIIPTIIADEAITIANVLTSDNPLELASIVSVTYGVVIASGDIITNNPIYSYAIKTMGLLLPSIVLPMFVLPVYRDKIQSACKMTTSIKNGYIIYNAIQELQHPDLDRYRKYYQTKIDKFGVFKGMPNKDIVIADRLYQLDKAGKISLASMDLVSTTKIMPMFIDKVVEPIWGNVDSALSFSLFIIRGEYSPIVAALFIGSGLLIALDSSSIILNPVINHGSFIAPGTNVKAGIFLLSSALFSHNMNYKQAKTAYKIATYFKVVAKVVYALDNFQQVDIFSGNKTFEQVIKNDQFVEGTTLAIDAVADIIVKDYLVFSINSVILNCIGVANPID